MTDIEYEVGIMIRHGSADAAATIAGARVQSAAPDGDIVDATVTESGPDAHHVFVYIEFGAESDVPAFDRVAGVGIVERLTDVTDAEPTVQ